MSRVYTDAPADAEAAQVEPMDAVEMDRGTWLTMPYGWKPLDTPQRAKLARRHATRFAMRSGGVSRAGPVGIMPAILLVPTSLSAIGTMLFKSLEIRDTTTNTKYPVANPHAGKFRVEVSRYLANAQYAGSSDKAWYLLADPTDLPVIEVAFLNGQESPTIETAEADFNVLGIRMRGFHDFGVSLQEPRGGVKMKGEA